MPSRAHLILRNIFHNQRTRLRHWTGLTGGYSGSRQETTAGRARHLQGVFERYLEYAGWTLGDLAGKTVLEMGPGDTLGVALQFARAGCAQVTTFDRFPYDYQSPYAREVEQVLGLDASLHRNVDPRCGNHLRNAGLANGSIDLIVSNAVLEEIPNPGETLATMRDLLRPGGVMAHQIDVSDYGIFSHHGFSRFEFLTIGDGLWRAMTTACGGPNRWLMNHYVERLESLGMQTRVLVTHLYGAGRLAAPIEREAALVDVKVRREIERIRPRLLERYQAIPLEILGVHGIFLVARKPEERMIQ
jgi:SAM-dependent methyltransferase